MYRYKCTVIRWIDGDTLVVDIKLGFFAVMERIKIRLEKVYAPELKTEDGKAFLQKVEASYPPGTELCVQTVKTEKYGRWLGTLFSESGEEINAVLQTWIDEAGYDCGRGKPKPTKTTAQAE